MGEDSGGRAYSAETALPDEIGLTTATGDFMLLLFFRVNHVFSRRKKISRLIDLAELTKRLKLTQFGCISWHEVHCTRKV
jgi:hypothetical protein